MYNKSIKGVEMQSKKTTFTLPDCIVDELAEFAKKLDEKKSHIVA